MPMMTKNRQWRLTASFFCLTMLLTPLADAMVAQPNDSATAITPAPAGLTPYTATYQVLRSGKVHGEAERYLTPYGRGYELGYKSKISWLIFKDERHELSRFNLEHGQLQPFFYQLRRWGTGPGRHYELNLDWQAKTLTVGKEKALKPLAFDKAYLDALSYHSQLVLQLAAGQQDFKFDVLSRHGDARQYHYQVTGKELLSVPAGKIDTIRIERVGDKQDKQVIAWVAPQLNYVLVKLWQAEDNVEQFDIQLVKYQQSSSQNGTQNKTQEQAQNQGSAK